MSSEGYSSMAVTAFCRASDWWDNSRPFFRIQDFFWLSQVARSATSRPAPALGRRMMMFSPVRVWVLGLNSEALRRACSRSGWSQTGVTFSLFSPISSWRRVSLSA